MKKVLAILMAMLMMLCSVAFADSAAQTATEEQLTPWYELSAENTVLTVRMPGNTKTGLTWFFEISDETALELLTCELVEGESEGMAGAPTTFVASFRAIGDAANDASLILRCSESEADAPVYTRVLDLNTSAANEITVNSVLERDPFADWCEYGDDGCVLTVRLPGAEWGFEIDDQDKLELLTCEGIEDTFVASFLSPMAAAGDAEIVFSSDDGVRFYTVNAFVNESGIISVNWVEAYEILTTEGLVFCEECSGWYEEGNIFRNHICTADVEEETVYFQTVNVTASSLNMRAGAGTGFDVVTVLKNGSNAKYLGETAQDAGGADWHKVTFGGKTGWVSAKYAPLGGDGYVKIVGGNCNVRSIPATDGVILSVANEGSIITYLGEGCTDSRSVDWYKVKVSGQEGWVSSKYATFVASAVETDSKKDEYKYVKIEGGDCNVRKSASLSAESVAVMKEGAIGSYLGEKATDDRGVVWYKVSYNGNKGWASSKFAKLSKTGPSAKPSNTKAPAEEPDDMRLVLNPNRYDVLCVTDLFSQDGRNYFVTGCFGTINDNGEPEYFDRRTCVTMALVPGAEVMLPVDPDNPEEIDYIESPEIWFNDARVESGGGDYTFYATFSMNESGALRSIVYREVY